MKFLYGLFLFRSLAIFGVMVGVSLTSNLFAQNNTVTLFPKGAPGEQRVLLEKSSTEGAKVGGETVLRVSQVGNPTLTIYQAPDDIATGAAVLVCPGGGYSILAYDLEGTEVCEWLNEIGVTAFLLKYRVPAREGQARYHAPLQDAQRAVSYMRSHASELNIDPARIGVIGFSAGAHLATMLSNTLERTYSQIDSTDQVDTRPNFCALIYPAYLSGENFSLAPEVKVSASTPPTFIVQAQDDKAYINSSIFYYYALKQAGVEGCLHLYPRGGHGFGLRDTGKAVNAWPDLMENWLLEMNVIDH